MRDAAPRTELYGAAGCPYTEQLRERLTWSRTAFVEYDVEADPEARARLLALTGQALVPVLVEDGRVAAIGHQGRACTIEVGTPRRPGESRP
jgi:mycoredoxin